MSLSRREDETEDEGDKEREGGKEGARIEVLKQLPNLTKIDGSMITPSERDKAAGVEE